LPYVRQAQKLYVETKLGTDLTDKLKAEITAGTLAGAYKTLVDDTLVICFQLGILSCHSIS
jgi:hypothetical protein